MHEYKESIGTCADCGNSPVNHFEQYVSNTLAVWTAASSYTRKGVFSALVQLGESVFDVLEQGLLRTLGVMPFVSYSSQVEGASTYRSQVVWEEAARRGIEMQQLCVFGKPTEIYRARIADQWFYFQSLPIPPQKKGKNVSWLDDKYLLKHFLASQNIPAPRSISVRTEKEALRAFDFIGGAVVVKPRSGSRGRHTTVFIRTTEELIAAFRSAKRLCAYVVIETYIPGPVCRATLVDGTLAGFFMANPPEIVGDGASSISELIEQKNVVRQARVGPVVLTEEHRRFLKRSGFDEDYVPHKGQRIALTHRTGRLFGGTTRELLEQVHPNVRIALEHAAASLGVGVVGFDVIISDPEHDPQMQQWGIIEANTLPYIDLHYLPLAGKPSAVASQIWDMWKNPMHSHSVDAEAESVTMQAWK